MEAQSLFYVAAVLVVLVAITPFLSKPWGNLTLIASWLISAGTFAMLFIKPFFI
ncbi:hypothetical protein bcgnr5378_37430 [Bacillus cereus]|uniref:hypothetical protein n=1 Tax=Bacillus cereus TaxID=1396 RepID=UPI000B2ECB60|nr:hypothetical protein [Bacillus cereus]GCF71346.1 hypothetical protein BC2903_51650 [Bacillus cereus]